MNLSPLKLEMLKESRLFLARAAPAGARDWVAEHPTYKPLIAEAEAAAASCIDGHASQAFRAYIAVWFRGFQDYIATMQTDQSAASATPWADLWHAGADAKGMPTDLWRYENGAWICTFIWPDPMSKKEIRFELRSRGKSPDGVPFVSAPEFALLDQMAPENMGSAVNAIVRLREKFPGAMVESVNGVRLVPEFLR